MFTFADRFLFSVLAESKNTFIKIVHNLLLMKLKPDEMLQQYKVYEDVIPLMEYVTNEVISAMKFMFDLEKLSSFDIFEIDQKR